MHPPSCPRSSFVFFWQDCGVIIKVHMQSFLGGSFNYFVVGQRVAIPQPPACSLPLESPGPEGTFKAQDPRSEGCDQGLPFCAISLFNKHGRAVLFLAGSEALGWGEQRDLCCSSVGCWIRRALRRSKGVEREMAKGTLIPGWSSGFQLWGAFVVTPGGAWDNRAPHSEYWHT